MITATELASCRYITITERNDGFIAFAFKHHLDTHEADATVSVHAKVIQDEVRFTDLMAKVMVGEELVDPISADQVEKILDGLLGTELAARELERRNSLSNNGHSDPLQGQETTGQINAAVAEYVARCAPGTEMAHMPAFMAACAHSYLHHVQSARSVPTALDPSPTTSRHLAAEPSGPVSP